MTKVVVVGNGMVGHRLCAKLRERAGGDRPRSTYIAVHRGRIPTRPWESSVADRSRMSGLSIVAPYT